MATPRRQFRPRQSGNMSLGRATHASARRSSATAKRSVAVARSTVQADTRLALPEMYRDDDKVRVRHRLPPEAEAPQGQSRLAWAGSDLITAGAGAFAARRSCLSPADHTAFRHSGPDSPRHAVPAREPVWRRQCERLPGSRLPASQHCGPCHAQVPIAACRPAARERHHARDSHSPRPKHGHVVSRLLC